MASSPEINTWNSGWRTSPLYRQILASVGANPDGAVKLTGEQKKRVQFAVEKQMGIKFPKGVEIDSAGNMNENEGFAKQAKKWGPIVGAAAVTMFGVPGVFPGLIGGVGTGGSAAAGAAAAGSGAGSVGAGTAGLAGGAAAAGGGAASWLRPLLSYGVPAATGLIGQHMANRADERGAAIQSDYLNRALEVEKEKEQYSRGQRADYLGRLKPYGDAGAAATDRASQLLSTSRYRPEVGAVGAVAGPGTVRLQDSTGQVREVPASEAEGYILQGAVRV